jgi:hypothetical protein
MYDNLDFNLSIDKVNNCDFLREIPNKLERTSEHFFNDGNDIAISGSLGLLKVSVSKNKVKIKDSSFCKWLLGDNLQGLYRGDVQRGFEKLSDLLGLPMEKANVTRIDLAQNLIVKYEQSTYLNHLGNLQYYSRMPQNNGLYYQNGNGKLVFYNKIHEANIKGVPIPEIFKNRHLLRYERRFTTKLANQFNMAEITVKSLYDEVFYTNIIDRWYNDYLKIQKIAKTQIDFTMVKKVSDLKNQGLILLVNQNGGLLETIKLIEEAKKLNKITSKEAFDQKKAINDAFKNDLFTSKSELITELDQKMKESIRFYR